MLNLSRWNDEAYFTVEHIAPQSQNSGWEAAIFNDPRTIHTLGNLTLLPKEANDVIGNKSWEHKRLMYSLLSAETTEEFEDIKGKLSTAGLTLSKTADQVLSNAKYLGICKSVALHDQPWSKEIIEKRTECFARLAWDRLAPWLYT